MRLKVGSPLHQNVFTPVELLLFHCRAAEEGRDTDSAHSVLSDWHRLFYMCTFQEHLCYRYKVPVIKLGYNGILSEKLFTCRHCDQIGEPCLTQYDLASVAFIIAPYRQEEGTIIYLGLSVSVPLFMCLIKTENVSDYHYKY